MDEKSPNLVTLLETHGLGLRAISSSPRGALRLASIQTKLVVGHDMPLRGFMSQGPFGAG
jgi:hypothetical protein